MTISFDINLDGDICTVEAEGDSTSRGDGSREVFLDNITVWLGGADITEDLDPDLLITLEESARELL